MPDIRLQDYVAEIKELIRNVRLDEAIAHSQHILRHHPKFVEAYALLGESCLEKEMYREAIEFFQRTLGADPENLISRVGLGVIYDEQGAFPEAIWQLERAFELVPGNAEVRRELMRLYGQYDGIDKTRLKLTRGALGRLYSRNGLYERAIGEFRAVLRQDPELPDIRVALIEALWREGRQVEAVETCLDLLDDLPNCLKANLILGDTWLRGGDEESAQQRLSVARELDPENKVAQELFGKDSPLPPEEVLIPELDVMPDEFDVAPVGGFAAEVVVAEEEVEGAWETDEELPEWLRDVGVTAEEPIEELAAEEVLEAPPDESPPTEDMPEWLQEVMEEEGPLPAAEPLVADAEPQEEELAADEQEPEPLPEVESLWGPEEEPEPAGAETPEEEMPEWLQELVGEAEALSGEEPAPEAEEHVAPLAEEVEVEAPAAEEVAPSEEEAPPEDGAPDWLSELDSEQVEEVAEPLAAEIQEEAPTVEEVISDEELPDWLRELDSAKAEEAAVREEAPDDEKAPDWLRDLDTEEVEEVAAPLAEDVAEEAEEVAAPLAADLHEESPTVEEEVISDEELPDWLRDLGVTEVQEEESVAGPPVDEVETVEIAPPPDVEQEEVPVAEEGTVEIAPPPDIEEEEVPVAEEEVPVIDQIPDWLRELDEAEEEAAAAEPPVAEPGEEQAVPESLRALVEAGLLDEADLDSAMAEMSAEELASQRTEEVPSWLRELVESETAAAAEAPAEAEVEPEPEPAAEEPEPAIEEVVEEPEPELAGEEAEAELVIEEVVEEPEPAVAEAEPESLVEEVEPEPEPEPSVEEAEPEPEPEPSVEEPEPEPELAVEEPVAEVELEPAVEEPEPEPEPEPVIEEAAVEPEPAVEDEVPAEAEIEPAVTEVEPERIDELMAQLKRRPRDYSARLELARLHYAEQDWDRALASYEKLISARRFLPDVVDDLESLVDQQVELSRIYHMLGDAYMQQDQLDEALEMYRLARQQLTKR